MNDTHPDRLLPMGVLSEREIAMSDLIRWGVGIPVLRREGVTDEQLLTLWKNLKSLFELDVKSGGIEP